MTNKTSKKLVKGIALAAVFIGTACLPIQNQTEFSELKSSTSSIDFKEFCYQAKLDKCSITPLSNINNDQWDAGVDTFNQVLKSDSFMTLTRSTFQADSVKSLVNTLGGQALIAFINRIPWESITISKSAGGVRLINERYTARASFNGLTFISMKQSYIRPSTGRKFSVDGIKLETALGVETITEIDLEDASRMHITTNLGQIRNVPVNFFYLEDQMMARRTEFTPGELVEAVSDVVLDQNITYSNDFYIDFNKQNISEISSPIMGNIKDGLGKDIAKLLLDKSKNVRLNLTPNSDIIRMSSSGHTRCEFKLGGHDSAIGIDKTIRVSSPVKQGDGIALKISGIAVTVKIGFFPINGEVSDIYLGPDKVTIKVLGKEFDLEYEGNENQDEEGLKGLN
jgi:hypothetical protein